MRQTWPEPSLNPLATATVLGLDADPYPAAESGTERTRSLLQRLAASPLAGLAPGLAVFLTTRSPLLLRDVDLLARLDRRHGVTVNVLIPAVDPRLARRLEAGRRVASPERRLELVHALTAQGIATRVLCSPVVPGVNNGVSTIRQLLGLAAQAGAFDVVPAPRHPALPPTSAEARQLLALFHRLRLEHGFPRTLPGRG
ncbi:MAG: hypothetical protein JOZ15_15765 [Acidobacteria bacterium]|nr:hypothetical protein [Acidobacteriota bacterium]